MNKKIAFISSLGAITIASAGAGVAFYVASKKDANKVVVPSKIKLDKPQFMVNDLRSSNPTSIASQDGSVGVVLHGFDSSVMRMVLTHGTFEPTINLIRGLPSGVRVQISIFPKVGYSWSDGTNEPIVSSFSSPTYHEPIVESAKPIIKPSPPSGDNAEKPSHPQEVIKRNVIQSAYWDGHSIHEDGALRFQIGSQTKMFTAASIFKLIDNGSTINGFPITLDTRLDQIFDQTYLNKFHGIVQGPSKSDYKVGQITIKQLVTHQSGLPDYLNLPGKSDSEIFSLVRREIGSRVASIDDVISIIKKYNNNGGTGVGIESYSNTGYFILGDVIQQVSKVSYFQYLTQNIFTPLGMDSTNFDYSDTQGWMDDEDANFVDKTLYYSAGSAASTLSDMIQWGLAIQTKDTRIMSKEKWDEWISIASGLKKFGAGLFTGSAIYFSSLAKASLLGHTGQTFGFQSGTIVDTKYIYVCSSNNGEDSIMKYLEKLKKEHPQV